MAVWWTIILTTPSETFYCLITSISVLCDIKHIVLLNVRYRDCVWWLFDELFFLQLLSNVKHLIKVCDYGDNLRKSCPKKVKNIPSACRAILSAFFEMQRLCLMAVWWTIFFRNFYCLITSISVLCDIKHIVLFNYVVRTYRCSGKYFAKVPLDTIFWT